MDLTRGPPGSWTTPGHRINTEVLQFIPMTVAVMAGITCPQNLESPERQASRQAHALIILIILINMGRLSFR